MPDDAGQRLVFAVPKGRILDELEPLLARTGIVPDPDFNNELSRALLFKTNIPDMDLIRVRAFDVATFVAFGAAQIGVVGQDVLEEFDYSELYSPLDLGIGRCRLSVAMRGADAATDDPNRWSHIRIATKYPRLTARHFAQRGVQTECIELHGAMEIAPCLGLAKRIVDLVSSGTTLAANGLVEIEKVMDVSSRLIVNRTALKTRPDEIRRWIEAFREAVATNPLSFDGKTP